MTFNGLKLRGVVVSLVSAVVIAVGLAAPTPASAAYPTCDDWSTHNETDFLKVVIPTVGNETGAFQCVMGPGSASPGVYVLQVALERCANQYVGPNGPDARYGAATEQAVRNVQAWFGLSRVDGVYGPETRGAMLRNGAWPRYMRSNGWFYNCNKP